MEEENNKWYVSKLFKGQYRRLEGDGYPTKELANKRLEELKNEDLDCRLESAAEECL